MSFFTRNHLFLVVRLLLRFTCQIIEFRVFSHYLQFSFIIWHIDHDSDESKHSDLEENIRKMASTVCAEVFWWRLHIRCVSLLWGMTSIPVVITSFNAVMWKVCRAHSVLEVISHKTSEHQSLRTAICEKIEEEITVNPQPW